MPIVDILLYDNHGFTVFGELDQDGVEQIDMADPTTAPNIVDFPFGDIIAIRVEVQDAVGRISANFNGRVLSTGSEARRIDLPPGQHIPFGHNVPRRWQASWSRV